MRIAFAILLLGGAAFAAPPPAFPKPPPFPPLVDDATPRTDARELPPIDFDLRALHAAPEVPPVPFAGPGIPARPAAEQSSPRAGAGQNSARTCTDALTTAPLGSMPTSNCVT